MLSGCGLAVKTDVFIGLQQPGPGNRGVFENHAGGQGHGMPALVACIGKRLETGPLRKQGLILT